MSDDLSRANPTPPIEGDAPKAVRVGGKFQPGRSGNPGGKPKGSVSLTTIIRNVLAEIDPESRRTKAETLIETAYQQAKSGNAPYFRELINRNDGILTEASVSIMINGKRLDQYTDEEIDAEISQRAT